MRELGAHLAQQALTSAAILETREVVLRNGLQRGALCQQGSRTLRSLQLPRERLVAEAFAVDCALYAATLVLTALE